MIPFLCPESRCWSPGDAVVQLPLQAAAAPMQLGEEPQLVETVAGQFKLAENRGLEQLEQRNQAF